MMLIALIILWVVWLIPTVLYIFWKRGDGYLFIIPPVVVTIIALIISCFSEVLGILVVVFIHIFLLGTFWQRINKR